VPNDMRTDVDNSMAAEDARKFGKTKIFGYYMSMGGGLKPGEQGLSEETVNRFNAALEYERQRTGQSANTIGDDFAAGLQEQGMSSSETVDPDGTRVIVAQPGQQ
jgi:hypothetical protein